MASLDLFSVPVTSLTIQTMKLLTLASLLALLPLASSSVTQPADPTPQHKWLGQLVGEWHTEVVDPSVGPEAPETKIQITDNVHAVGEYWIVSESETRFSSGASHFMMTIGYDPEAKEFIGSWIDANTSHMWTLTGSLDEERQMLTLHGEGPGVDGKPARFRDDIQLDSPNQKTHRSFLLGVDGKWAPIGEVTYLRKE